MPSPRSRFRRATLVAAALAAPFVAAACEPLPAVPTPTTTPVTTLPKVVTASATCTTTSTRSIVVSSTIVNSTRRLLAAAKADGVLLCGGGYRSPEGQIAVRRANCGPTNYDIYEKPASQCTPPTARPGTSMHEQGLAIDFENCSTQTTKCFLWLKANAATYGFKNLPSEPWHWSTNGH